MAEDIRYFQAEAGHRTGCVMLVRRRSGEHQYILPMGKYGVGFVYWGKVREGCGVLRASLVRQGSI